MSFLSRHLCFHIILLLALFSSASSLAANPPSPQKLKMLQLNFNSEEVPNDSDFAVRDARFAATVKWVHDNKPDIIFLEEAWTYRDDHTIAQTLARAIGYDLAYRLEMGLPDFFYEAVAVLSKKSLAMHSEVNLKLPHSAVEIGDGKTWVVEFGAVSYAVGVKMKMANGDPLYVYAAHLTGDTASQREDQAQAIIDNAHLRTSKDGLDWDQAQVLIGADFNSAPNEPSTLAVLQAGFVDTFAAAHPGDSSCTDCQDPTYPWFNPFTLVAGLFPSQADYSTSLRDDYIFVHSPTLKTLASTLMFTTPLNNIWMSDHYGVQTMLGEDSSESPANPVHDTSTVVPNPPIVDITTDHFLCSSAWLQSVNPHQPKCIKHLPPSIVNGPRGIVIENRSSYPMYVEINGPGTILAANSTWLNPKQQVDFVLSVPGDYKYTIRNNLDSPEPYAAELVGHVHFVSGENQCMDSQSYIK